MLLAASRCRNRIQAPALMNHLARSIRCIGWIQDLQLYIQSASETLYSCYCTSNSRTVFKRRYSRYFKVVAFSFLRVGMINYKVGFFYENQLDASQSCAKLRQNASLPDMWEALFLIHDHDVCGRHPYFILYLELFSGIRSQSFSHPLFHISSDILSPVFSTGNSRFIFSLAFLSHMCLSTALSGVSSHLVLSYLILSYLILSYLILSYLIQ